MRPLFIPLTREWFAAFADGRKTVEYRPYGPGWNERTCTPGRTVTLSLGYGKRQRMAAVVDRLEVLEDPPDPAAWQSVYPGRSGPVAAIHLRDIERLPAADFSATSPTTPMSDDESRRPGAPYGNRNAVKPDDQKVAGKGRIVADFGDLKGQCVRASRQKGMKLVDWLREAAEEKLERDRPQDSG
jgi:hypothetical protein